MSSVVSAPMEVVLKIGQKLLEQTIEVVIAK